MVTVTLIDLPSFCTFSSPKVECSPTSASDKGKHIIQVQLSDGNLSKSYNLELNVMAKVEPPYVPPVKEKKYENIVKESISQDLTFSIKEVTSVGEIVVEFSDELIVPQNYEDFNEEVLEITLKNYEYPE